MRSNLAFVGAGQTVHARRRADVNLVGLAHEAVARALAEAELLMTDIDSVVVCTGISLLAAVHHPEKWLADALGARHKPVVRVASGGGSAFAAVTNALTQIGAGFAERVLIVACDKPSEGTLSYGPSPAPDPVWGRETAVEMMGVSAAHWRARMNKLGHTEKAAAMVAVKNRANALLNPFAHAEEEITVDEVLKSPRLCSPIKALDVPPVSDGACAIVVASEEAAKASPDPAWVRGMAYCAEAESAARTPILHSAPLILAAQRAYVQAGITNPRRQCDIVEIQDHFTCLELSYYEDLGLCEPGGAADLIASGATARDGDIPVNPSGGCMGANPIGATGLIRFAEVVQQVRGRCAGYQIPNVRVGLVQAGGGPANQHGVAVISASKH